MMTLFKTICQQFFSNNKSNKAKAILPVDQYTNNEKEYNEPAANIPEQILITGENLVLYNELKKIIEENKTLLKNFGMLFYFERRIQEFRKQNKIPDFTLNYLVNYINELKVINLKTEKYRLRFKRSFATFAYEFKSPAVQEIYKIIEDIKFYLDNSKTDRINKLISMMPEILEMEKKDQGNYAMRVYYFEKDGVKDEIIFPNDEKQKF